jgi:hypothetical protein
MKSKQIKKDSGLKRKPISAAKSRPKVNASKPARSATPGKAAKPAKPAKSGKSAKSGKPVKPAVQGKQGSKAPRGNLNETRGQGRGEHKVANEQAKSANRKRAAGGTKSTRRASPQATKRRGRDLEADRKALAEDHQTHDMDASIAEQAVGTTNAAPLNDVPPPTDETAINRVHARKR